MDFVYPCRELSARVWMSRLDSGEAVGVVSSALQFLTTHTKHLIKAHAGSMRPCWTTHRVVVQQFLKTARGLKGRANRTKTFCSQLLWPEFLDAVKILRESNLVARGLRLRFFQMMSCWLHLVILYSFTGAVLWQMWGSAPPSPRSRSWARKG